MHRRESSGALVSPWRVGAEFRPRLNSMNNLVRNPTKFSGTSGEAETASQWAEFKKSDRKLGNLDRYYNFVRLPKRLWIHS